MLARILAVRRDFTKKCLQARVTLDTISLVKKNHKRIATIFSWLGTLAYVCLPLAVWAQTPAAGTALPPVLISEVQMGSTNSASEEFIELYNASPEPINFDAHNWRLEVASSSASSWVSPLRTISLYKVLQPGKSYVIASQYASAGEQAQYLSNLTVASFSSGLSYTSGHVRLLYDTNQLDSSNVCAASSTVVDEVEWTVPKSGGVATQSLDARQQYVSGKTSGVAAGTSLQRYIDPTTTTYVDTDNDAADFIAGAPTPGATNGIVAAQPASGGQAQPGLPIDACNPAPPASGSGDSDEPDNPSDSGSSGSDSSTDGTDTPGNESDDGDSDPVVPAANAGLLPPAITELLPNPASPQTDAADEFIELYNPNQSTFDLSGYQLQAGATSTRTYAFPPGTQLTPGNYTAFFSADTGLTLSNTGGQVKLLDASGAALSASDLYGTAKDNQAWAIIDNKWQWTLTPTPNAPNKLTASAATAKTAAAKKATAKVKAAATTKTKTKAKVVKAKTSSSNAAFVADAPTTRIPVHPAVLAAIGVAAVLYGAYEYRQDVANYFRRLRENRAAGRKNRRQAERRGDN